MILRRWVDKILAPVVFLATVALGHRLGEHGLSGANPRGAPELPPIHGPFTVEMNVKFEALRPTVRSRYQTIFEYSDITGTNTIWFGQHHLSDELAFYLTRGTDRSYCFQRGANSIDVGVFMKLSFGLDSKNQMWIRKNGSLVVECATSIQLTSDDFRPLRRLGIGAGVWSVDPLVGCIEGVRVTNLEQKSPHHSLTALALQNLPGQIYGNGFVVSFYVRFDDLSDRRNQRVFDFGNESGLDSVWCGQLGRGRDMACEVYHELTPHRIVAQAAIPENEYAFWHFGVDSDGTFWIERDGKILVSEKTNTLPTKVFRRRLGLGESNDPGGSNDDFLGVILGLRVDSVRAS